jgi:outer membrane receptor for ferrienterochelin and colicins
MFYKISLVFIVLFTAASVHAQYVHGVVLMPEMHEHDNDNDHDNNEIHLDPVPGAVVKWAGHETVTLTDDKGRFRLKSVGYPAKLVILVPGAKADTLLLSSHPAEAITYIAKTDELPMVEVKGRSSGFSFVQPRNMQLLTQTDIKKAACCNLSESFETNASVDVNYTDAVSGTKTIRMLGLDGVYTQMMFENVPFIRGLESKFGLTLLPGTWVESIQISKGAGSVTNGFESMTGQINIEFQKPDQNEREQVYANVYLNSMLRMEANVHYRHRFSKVWSMMGFLHAMQMDHFQDLNKDGFMDTPLNKTLAGMWRFRYDTKSVEGQITFGGSYRANIGGQNDYHKKDDDGGHNHGDPIFGVETNSRQGYIMWKNGFLMPNQKFGTLGLLGMARYYDMEAMFGNHLYKGIHRHAYINSIYESILGNTLHKYRTGVSFQTDEYREVLNDSAFNRTEHIPGAHFEYTYNDDFKVQTVAGIRVDYHNLYGFWITPRFNFRWTIDPNSVLRFSAGRGYRRPNVIAENLSVFASSRVVRTTNEVRPEETWNAGVSLNREFRIGKRKSEIRMDYYYTWFANQMVVNMEDPRSIYFENLNGKAFSHAAQIDWLLELSKGFDLTAAYRFNLVKSTYFGELKDMPFIPRDRAMINLAYETGNKRWRFDITGNFFGYSRLPDTRDNPEEHRLKSHSDVYFTFNTQITRVFKHFEVYLGGENLLNYIQPNAIIDAQNPFGNYFDASLIWGPLNGAIGYIGLRTNLKSDRNVKIKEK